ncbi:SIMPL domain-containing protein [Longimicrobium terrae]|uniref:DUF541 domain-containing protein n=1 Tax=Longimicrobium terrae TaxID=1639882 RepID=A0A841GJY2_9BACT|nr:SIMPL domain-containing protein [Longimicrobium terrae]MBB4634223.1 hypothetical protein [Longimicrobium terrae]MBB6068887.1 hypothetical protein [Longimicrobium terrae]NNC28067.1 SIMPL domain-containing protein [Longimicrobium terrae]
MRLLVRPLLMLTLALAGTATAASAQEAETLAGVPEIVSSASAEQPVRADLALVTLRFGRVGRTPAEAGRNTALAADSLRRMLRPLGIPADSVISASTWYWWRGRVEAIVANRSVPRWVEDGRGGGHRSDSTVSDTTFRVSESLQVRIRDLRRVGAVIDAALAAGITDISDVTFSATNTENEQREAIRLATQRARRNAEAIALAGGGRVGRTLRLSTDGNGAAPRSVPYDVLHLEAVTAEDAGGAPGSTVVVGPVLRVSATVHGRWQLVEGS